MKRPLIVFAVVAVAAMVAFGHPAEVQAQAGPNVTVVNPADQPVPVFNIGSLSEEEPFQRQVETIPDDEQLRTDGAAPYFFTIVEEEIKC